MRAKRIDSNQNEVVEGLRKCGALVAVTSGVGSGFPDIVVGFRGKLWLLEIKDGTKPPSARKLTKDEIAFHDLWNGYVHIINSLDEALQLIGAVR